MGFTRSIQRLLQRKKIKDYEERKKNFMDAHDENVRKYKCDFGARLILVAEDSQAVATINIFDATEMLEKEEEKKKESSNKSEDSNGQ